MRSDRTFWCVWHYGAYAACVTWSVNEALCQARQRQRATTSAATLATLHDWLPSLLEQVSFRGLSQSILTYDCIGKDLRLAEVARS